MMKQGTIYQKSNLLKKPKQPLSAYNLFFQIERKRILDGTDQEELTLTLKQVAEICREHKARGKRLHRKTHGQIGFRELARRVAQGWKKVSPETRKVLEDQARIEKDDYAQQLRLFKEREEEEAAAALAQQQQQQQGAFLMQSNPGILQHSADLGATSPTSVSQMIEQLRSQVQEELYRSMQMELQLQRNCVPSSSSNISMEPLPISSVMSSQQQPEPEPVPYQQVSHNEMDEWAASSPIFAGSHNGTGTLTRVMSSGSLDRLFL